ncbi:MAG TPA: ATP-binding protein [Opitutus sp.]|nr:ATP-binding protein [Opitutus sp.]
MAAKYVQVIVMLHGAFALVFYFLDRKSPSRFTRLFAISWAIEAVRAAILLPGVAQLGGAQELWFAASDVLCFVANWCLLAGCAGLVGVTLPRWLAPLYFWSGIPLVLFNRFLLVGAWAALTGVSDRPLPFDGFLANMVIIFVPVAAARLAVLAWLTGLWRRTHLLGALVAAIFCVPYAVVALAVPLQFYFDYSPEWISLIWSGRVLGFSIGLVMLQMDLQQAAQARVEANLTAAQALAKVGSWEVDYVTGVATWSAEMYRLYGVDPALGVMRHEQFLALMHPADRPEFVAKEQWALKNHSGTEYEFRATLPDGTLRWIHGRKTPYFSATGQLVRMIGVEQDITERKQAELRAALRHAVTSALAEADTVERTMGKVLEVIARGLEAKFAAFWALDDAEGVLRCAQTWHEPSPELAQFAQASRGSVLPAGVGLPGRLMESSDAIVADEETLGRWMENRRRDAARAAGLKCGSGFPIRLHGGLHGVVEFYATEVLGRDPENLKLFGDLGTQIGQFVDRQQFAERYRQAQKLEAVGTLAGGIAHDFNNILTAITGYSELAMAETAALPLTQSHLRAVQTASRRAADLVRQIKTFSRQEEQSRVPLALGSTVREALHLLRATIPATIEISLDEEGDLPPILADATSIHQIVLNLGTNASHAMNDQSGRIDVKLHTVTVDTRFVVAHPGLQPGRYVRLAFRDSGAGMDAATCARIFEPFFTTKSPGEGTGLGLAVVHGIVQSHNGSIFVESEPGAGTEFVIHFPVWDGPVAAPAAEVAASIVRGGGERVMYVDDETLLTDMGRMMLTRLGYAVEVFAEPAEALETLKQRAGEFSLLITDLSMRGMTGLELAARAKQVRPDLPIVLTSGNVTVVKEEQMRAAGISDFLVKPYTVQTFSALLSQVLAGASRPATPEPGATA